MASRSATTRFLLAGIGLLLVDICWAPQAAPAVSSERATLDRYCVRCHNARQKEAGLLLDVANVDQVGEAPETWEKVVHKLRTRAMPPAGSPRPDAATYEALASSLEASLDKLAAASPDPGRPGLHRLNRAEYANAIRDLLALDVDASALLPPDAKGDGGFDNIADTLSVSPGLLDRYMAAANRISRLALGDPTLSPVVEVYPVSRLLRQRDRVSEDLPFGSRGGIAVRHTFPLDGEYIIKLRIQRSRQGAALVRGLAERNLVDIRIDGRRVGEMAIGGLDARAQRAARQAAEAQLSGQEIDDGLEVRVSVTAGPHVVGATFVKTRSVAFEDLGPGEWPIGSYAHDSDESIQMGLDTVQIAGPYHGRTPATSPSRERILTCRPQSPKEEPRCAQQIVSRLARLAFRRPVEAPDLAPLLSLYDEGRRAGGFEKGLQRAIEGLLVDPDFLFRVERDPAGLARGSAYRLTDLELASRLSFFLWSSIPDDELITLAAKGRLKDAMVLDQQVRRMLADERSKALVENFFGEWLQIRNVQSWTPDATQYPEFTDNIRAGLLQETRLFLDSQLREDRSALDLIRADYTYLNETLARHYGIPGVYGSSFRRVKIEDPQRQGLLGQGSLLMVTSYAHRTSPVLRGRFILENFLASPPPAPPPNVPPLPENGEGVKAASVRDRLEQHRKNPMCATCHAQMDPLGFALENFDAVGKWRSSDAGKAIDAIGTLADGTPIEGVVGLRKILLERPDLFATAVTEKLLTYAVGRGLTYRDNPAVRRVVRRAAASDYRWSSVILELVKSPPFQQRRGASS